MGRRRRFPPELLNVTFSGIADKGFAVGRNPEGVVVFAEDAVPGDVADVTLFRKKKGVLFGRVKQLHQPSPDRTEPFCAHFGVCGGCKWQNLSYEGQLRHKEQVVHDAFRRIGQIPVEQYEPILGGPATRYYRNKLEFGCANRRWLTEEELQDEGISNSQDVIGFHRPGAYDKIIQIDECFLQGDPSNALRNGIRAIAREQGLPFFDMREHHGLLRQLVVRTSTLGEVMLIIAFYQDDQQRIRPFLDAVLAAFPQITTLYYVINHKVNEFLLDLDMQLYHGPGYIQEQLGHIRYRIGPKSFFQTNTEQAVRLYETTAEFAGLQGTENVYDLYTGIGSIALFLAGRARQVVGIEEIPAAIEDAKVNAALNGIDNVQFYAGDVKDMLSDEFAQRHGLPDVLITDPPRAGMHPKVVQYLLNLGAPRIVYVSCNPATQARDLQGLGEQYAVRRVRPVDMFPHTSHVENVALLEKRS
ncbi:MAG: 23S rRNA (uracil(1939)-C(5))-methyltransferase RlmD [Lewinella sp.]|nr:23S rRNA (uracil(1939)-C(5))-methyltransferase RlmD [Lewinella sp.]